MSKRSRVVYFLLCLIVAFGVQVGRARAGGVPDSDRMVVTDNLSGTVLFDGSIAEPPAAGGPEILIFPVGNSPFPPSFDSTLTYIALIEPAGAPPEPGGEPPIFLPGTNSVVSDLVISSLAHDPTSGPRTVELLSDLDPNFAQVVSALPPRASNVFAVEETGSLQDLSILLGTGGTGGVQVQVQSDVVPEPGTFALLGLGLLGLAAQGRRRRPMGGSR